VQLGHSVAVAFERPVNDVRASVVQVWHDGLVHGTIPLHVAWNSESVSVARLVVHVVDRLLTSLPLTVRIWHWRVLWKNATHIPVEKVWVVSQRLCVDVLVVHHDRALVEKTTAKTSHNKEGNPGPGDHNSGVEVLERQFSNKEQTEETSDLSASGVVCPVKVRLVHRASNLLHFTAWEPASQD